MQKLNVVLLFLMIFHQSNLFTKNHIFSPSLTSCIVQPNVAILTGLASLSSYCLYNQECVHATYEWFKQQCGEYPGLCIGIGAFFGWWLLSSCYERQNAHVKIKKKFDALEKRLLAIERDKEEGLINNANRLSNLELIILGKETDEGSFGTTAPLFTNRLDAIEKQIDNVKDDLLTLKVRISALEDSFVENKVALENTIKEIKQMILSKQQANHKNQLMPTRKPSSLPPNAAGSPARRSNRRNILLLSKSDD